MFLDYLKKFVIKKIVNKALSSDVVHDNVGKISTVGIIADEMFLTQTESLKQRLIENGICESDIFIIIRSAKAIATTDGYVTFNSSTVSSSGSFLNPAILQFVETDFDLLINYYEQEKPVALMASALSKAKFKVGFSTIDKRVKNNILDISPDNYQIFEEELFKYLKILN